MDTKTHYTKQIDYFDKEFSEVSEYNLAAWQKSYIEKIKQYFLDTDLQGKTLLDVGAGSGYVAVELARRGVNVIACDLSPQAIKNLETYKKKLGLTNLRLIICNAEELPLNDESVDYLVANALLEHLPNERKAISQWKRVLKKDGKMLITVPLSFRYIWPFLWPINYFYDKRLGHLRRYDEGSLKKKFKLKAIKTFYTGHLLKVLGLALSMLFGTHAFDGLLERLDAKSSHIAYGANNITVIFQK